MNNDLYMRVNKENNETSDTFSELESLLKRKESIRKIYTSNSLNTETMPVHVMVWFNIVTCEIINSWNEGNYTITGEELLERVISKMSLK